MQKDYLGTINIEGSEAFTKFTKGICKTLKAEQHDISVVEVINLTERVDKVNETNTIAKSRAEQSRGLATFMVKKVAAMQGKFMTLMRFVLRSQTCKVEGGNRTSWKLKG